MSATMDATIDLIRRYYAAFNAGDMQTFESLLTDDVIHDINQGQREIGRDAFRKFMDRMNGAYRENLTDLSIMASADAGLVAKPPLARSINSRGTCAFAMRALSSVQLLGR